MRRQKLNDSRYLQEAPGAQAKPSELRVADLQRETQIGAARSLERVPAHMPAPIQPTDLAMAVEPGDLHSSRSSTDRTCSYSSTRHPLVILSWEMAMDLDLARLRGWLADRAYEYRGEGEPKFQLASGRESNEYMDCKKALSHPDALATLGRLFAARLQPKVIAVGGLTMGADPIAISVALETRSSSRPRRWFSVRKTPKSHGQRRLVEGDVRPGNAVAVVDDVVTAGGSTITAVQCCKDAGLNVVQVLVLVDRQAGGLDAIRGEVGGGVPVDAVFTKSEIHEGHPRARAERAIHEEVSSSWRAS